MEQTERSTGFNLQSIGLNVAGEYRREIVSVLKAIKDVLLENSP